MYYYNTRTGETSWIAPDDFVHQKDAQGSWRRFDDEEGNTFYYNIHTGESSWVVPENDEETNIEVKEGDDVQNKDEGGSEWIPCVDDETGQTYYWNRITGESNWEVPDETTVQTDVLGEVDEGFVTETTDGWLTEATTSNVSEKHRKGSGDRGGRRAVLPFSTDEALSSGYTTEETYRP